MTEEEKQEILRINILLGTLVYRRSNEVDIVPLSADVRFFGVPLNCRVLESTLYIGLPGSVHEDDHYEFIQPLYDDPDDPEHCWAMAVGKHAAEICRRMLGNRRFVVFRERADLGQATATSNAPSNGKRL